MKGRVVDFNFQLSNLSPWRTVRHYKGRRYVYHRDPYSAAREALLAYETTLAAIRVKVEGQIRDRVLTATVSTYLEN